jgi:cytochrome c553
MKVRFWGFVSLAAVSLAALVACTTNTETAQSAAVSGASGSAVAESCAACHRNDAKVWRESYHARVARSPHDALLKEAKEHWSVDSKGNAGPATGNIDGLGYGLADVQMVIGTRWKQRFLVKVPSTGHHQFLDKQWNSYTGAWEAYGNKDLWEAGCTTCHTTGDGAGPPIHVDQSGTSSGDL